MEGIEKQTDLDKQEGESCSLVSLVTRIPGGELLVHLLVLVIMMTQMRMQVMMEMVLMLVNMVIDMMAAMVTFSVSSSSRSSGVRDSRKVQSGCLGAILTLFSSRQLPFKSRK